MIGYYAHSHGSGHCNYARSFAHVLGNELIVFTDRKEAFNPETKVVRLPDEDVDGTEFQGQMFEPPRALHYAPVNLHKLARRNEIILQTALKQKIKLLIVDVSVEVAMLARVSSIPYIYRRQPGDRNDLPHLNAYDGAALLVAYYPPELESDNTPAWVVQKTVYLGFISKHLVHDDSRPSNLHLPYNRRKNLVHIIGFGGSDAMVFDNLREEYNIYGVGRYDRMEMDAYDEHFGSVASTRPFIDAADLIFASCGANSTSEILSSGKRFVAIPETRPFDEQQYTAKALQKNGWAVDYSHYNDSVAAVKAFVKMNSEPLPRFDTERFKLFCSELKSFDFQLDRFYRDSTLFSEKPSTIIH